ncbi:Glutathione S-transferase class-mu 28 kDa isozyme [Clonorchis sinensis]|uniref:Glutathione S-transferase class-mu 28 kDa isozyme n=1 Tax=Clonorchis sinensis TaxID=79923 RepID=A0A8T1MVP7_CLOSI|nr:Glutathione S-transferase class-mu 28 kDa isozyme [Clonorchis sinensis]
MKRRHCTLFYLNFRCRAEAIRMILHANGVSFEDVRFTMEEWAERKHEFPGGKLPVFQVREEGSQETKTYTESLAISRALAKHYGMMGDSKEEYYPVERVIGQSADLHELFVRAFFAPPDQRKELLEKAMSEEVPRLLDLICNSLSDSGGKFVAGDKVTLGDIYLLASMEHVRKADSQLLQTNYPKLLTLEEEVLKALPKLAEYVRTRPETPL